MGETTNGHPDLLDLDALRAGEGQPAHHAHVQSCAQCAHVMAELQSVASELRDLSSPRFSVPPEIDSRILWNARKQAAAVKTRAQTPLNRLAMPHHQRWAIAAAILLTFGALTIWNQRGQLTPSEPVRLAKITVETDIDRSGTVDILDAFALARAVRARAAHPEWDVDADGTIDDADVRAVAEAAVKLGSS